MSNMRSLPSDRKKSVISCVLQPLEAPNFRGNLCSNPNLTIQDFLMYYDRVIQYLYFSQSLFTDIIETSLDWHEDSKVNETTRLGLASMYEANKYYLNPEILPTLRRRVDIDKMSPYIFTNEKNLQLHSKDAVLDAGISIPTRSLLCPLIKRHSSNSSFEREGDRKLCKLLRALEVLYK